MFWPKCTVFKTTVYYRIFSVSFPVFIFSNVLSFCRRLQIPAITTEGGDGRYPASFLFFPFPLSSRLFGLSNYRLGLQALLLPIFFFRAMPGAWPGGFFRGISTRGRGKEDNFGPDLCPALWSFAVTILPVLCSRSDLPWDILRARIYQDC